MSHLKELKKEQIPAKIFKENPRCRFYASKTLIYVVPKTEQIGLCRSITLIKQKAIRTYPNG